MVLCHNRWVREKTADDIHMIKHLHRHFLNVTCFTPTRADQAGLWSSLFHHMRILRRKKNITRLMNLAAWWVHLRMVGLNLQKRQIWLTLLLTEISTTPNALFHFKFRSVDGVTYSIVVFSFVWEKNSEKEKHKEDACSLPAHTMLRKSQVESRFAVPPPSIHPSIPPSLHPSLTRPARDS